MTTLLRFAPRAVLLTLTLLLAIGGCKKKGQPGGCVDDAACTQEDGQAGLCKSGVCSSCIDGGDDAVCSLAYGTAASSFMCTSGACVAAGCRDSTQCAGELCTTGSCIACVLDADCVADPSYGAGATCLPSGACALGACQTDDTCPVGQLCGATAPNVCSPCTADADCQNHSGTRGGASTVCDSTGACVAATCTQGATAPSACSTNTADVCCGAILGNGADGTCQAGNCCQDADCSAGSHCVKPGGATDLAVAGVCSACPAVTDNVYYVDPNAGDDTAGTGTSGTTACAFRTVGRAIAFLPKPALLDTKIVIVGKGAGMTTDLDASEHWPIALPAHVTLSIKTGTGSVTAKPPAAAPSVASLTIDTAIAGTADESFTFDGAAMTTAYAPGITILSGQSVSLGGADAVSTLSYVTVTHMRGDGIYVTGGGKLTLGARVTATHNGTALTITKGPDRLTGGLHVTGAVGQIGVANANQKDPNAAIELSQNVQYGLLVDGYGQVDFTGATSAVQISQNVSGNVLIDQVANKATPVNNLDGVTIKGNNPISTVTLGDGLRISVGSKLTLRNSSIVGNGRHGVHVIGGAMFDAVSFAGIDLGTATNGHNRLQDAGVGSPNAGVGLCVELGAVPTAPLSAEGNHFTVLDCSNASGTLTSQPGHACTGGKDYGWIVPGAVAGTQVMDVKGCTLDAPPND